MLLREGSGAAGRFWSGFHEDSGSVKERVLGRSRVPVMSRVGRDAVAGRFGGGFREDSGSVKERVLGR